jgi:hypothetical protein
LHPGSIPGEASSSIFSSRWILRELAFERLSAERLLALLHHATLALAVAL